MIDLPWYKKILGYIYPVVIARHKNDKHTDLKIKFYQGQLQLECEDALYSDGYRYTPFRLAYNYLHKQKKLQAINSFLLLGAGLGSALLRLQKVYKLYPTTKLIEYDADILKLSQDYLLGEQERNVHFVRQEAMDYLVEDNSFYDLIGIDLFDELENSYLITHPPFWLEVKKRTNPQTQIIVNTIFVEKKALQNFEYLISQNFTFVCLKRAPNYIYVMQTII